MWKKDERPDESPAPRREASPETRDRVRSPSTGERAAIGRSIRIRGEVSGDEDLLIQGHVDGSVNLREHSVTVGSEGSVTANITARVVTVEGRVQGDLTADEQIILRSSAQVEGDITAPRVVLEDGARFRGGVDMGELEAAPRSSSRSEAARSGSSSGGASSGQGSSGGSSTGSAGGSEKSGSGAKGGSETRSGSEKSGVSS